MALRAFHANPCIGGFGGENTTTPSLLRPGHKGPGNGKSAKSKGQPSFSGSNNSGDAFCQIVKELVDNAVDAVNTAIHDEGSLQGHDQQMRIRVEIKPCPRHPSTNEHDANDTEETSDLLQIDVNDNGCGMEDIQKCVNAFHSTKANSQSQGNGGGGAQGHSNTSGRYGIGLTLCLLHAQRLVPNSCCCITSATREMDHFTRAIFVVDPENDVVVCDEVEQLPKQDNIPAGTSVKLLIPRSAANSSAWERLVAYFYRFRLCPNLDFGLEVMAPSLASVPMFIRPNVTNKASIDNSGAELKGTSGKTTTKVTQDTSKSRDDSFDISSWDDVDFDKDETTAAEEKESPSDDDDSDSDSMPPIVMSKSEPRRMEVMAAAKAYWSDRKMALKNTAVSTQRIRADSNQNTAHSSEQELEVNMIVCPLPSRNEPDDSYDDFSRDGSSVPGHVLCATEDEPATIELVRMVNDVPLLDGAEAHSCGLVHGLADKTAWGSFGLEVSRKATGEPSRSRILPSTGCKWTPTFELQDDARVGAFIQRDTNHKQLHCLVDDDYYDGECDNESFNSADSQARKRSALKQMDDLLPAGIRLHSILVVVRIRAAPESLPLPTLSKGRLPLNHTPINDALHRGLNECLQSLQRTNPLLLLSPNQLSSVVRDVRYIPKLAKELALSVFETRNPLFLKRANEILAIASEIDPTKKGNAASQASFASHESDEKIDPTQLSNAFRSVLSFKVQARIEALQEKKKREREDAKAARSRMKSSGEGYQEIGCGSQESSGPARNSQAGRSIDSHHGNESHNSRHEPSSRMSTSSWKEVDADSLAPSAIPQEQNESGSSVCSTAPVNVVHVAGMPPEESEEYSESEWLD